MVDADQFAQLAALLQNAGYSALGLVTETQRVHDDTLADETCATCGQVGLTYRAFVSSVLPVPYHTFAVCPRCGCANRI